MVWGVTGIGAVGQSAGWMNGRQRLETPVGVMNDIRQWKGRDGIDRPLLPMRPAKKYTFVPLPSARHVQSRTRRGAVIGASTPAPNTASEPDAILPERANAAAAEFASGRDAAINWSVLDDADANIGRQGRFDNFEAMHGWLSSGGQADKYPLDIAQFDPAALERLHAGARSAMHYAAAPGQATDPALLQYLLKDFFLRNAAPFLQGSDGDDGAPFTRNLLSAMRRNATPDPDVCGSNAGLAAPLWHVAALKADLMRQFLLDNKMFYPGPEQQGGLKLVWIFESMCQLAEPTMARRDLPDNFLYGSLEWVLLSLGMHLAGDTQWQLRAADLIALAIAFDIRTLIADTSGESMDNNDAVTRKMAMRLIFLMAHAEGKIDLLQPALTQEKIEVAIALFDEKWSSLIENSEPLKQCMQRLPKRSEVAKEMMAESGFDADGQCFETGIRSRQVFSNLRSLPSLCTPTGKKHRMYEVMMMGCLGRNEFGNQLSPQQKIQLASPALSYTKLAARFQQKFDQALLPLSQEIMLPLLAQWIKHMDVEDARFWREGVWTVRVPRVNLQSKTKVSQYVGQFSAGQGYEMYGSHKMKGVLVQITIDRDPQPESRHYWATFHPFKLCRYHESDMALLDSNIERFFQIGKTSRQPSIEPYSIEYEVRHKDNSEDNLLQSVTALLLHPYASALRDYATEVTQAEKTRISKQEMRLNLIPFRASIKAVQAGDLGGATSLGLLMDIACLIPFFAAGANLAKAGIGVGKSMTAGQIGNAARTAILGRVSKSSAMQTVPLVLKIGAPTIDLAIQGIRLLDIGFELSYHLMASSFRLSAAKIRAIKRQIHGLKYLTPLETALDSALPSRAKPYRRNPGFRLAQADVPQKTGVAALPQIAGSVLCRSRRAHGNIPACVTRDIQIGDRVLYHWTGFVSDKVYQLPLLAPLGSVLRAGGSMVEVGRKQFSIIGFPASGEVINDMVPQLTGQSLLSRSFPVLLEDSGAWLKSSINAQGDVLNHLELSIPDSGGSIVATHYLGFGTYEALAMDPIEWRLVEYKDIKIEAVGIVYLVPGDPATAYRFSFDKSRMPIRKDESIKVQLHPATAEEIAQYRKFQSLIAITQANYGVLAMHALRLGNAEPALQNKFAAVFQRTEALLAQAQYIFTRQSGTVRNICKRILNLPFSLDNIAKIDRVVNKAHLHVTLMQRLMPELQRQSGHFMGFFTDTTNSYLRAAAFPFSLALNLDVTGVKNPLIIFEKNYFLRDDVALDNHAATLIHELSHALFGTDDAMVPFGPEVYSTSSHANQFTMTPISAAAEHSLSVPENHAPTLEHLTILAAYADDKNKYMLDIFMSDAQVPGQAVYPRYWKYGQGNEVKAGIGGLPPLCRNQRAIGAWATCFLPLLRDGRFGAHGYSRPDVPERQAFQLQTTLPGMVIKKINLADVGFNTRHTGTSPADALTDASPKVALARRYGTSGASWKDASDLAVQYGLPSSAKIMRFSNKGDSGQTEYALLEFADGLIRHARYIPFSSYQDVDGAWVNLIAFGAQKYVFKNDGKQFQNGGQVALIPASPGERGKHYLYQQLLNSQWPAPEVLPAHMMSLADRSAQFQHKFRFLLSRTQTILDDAVGAIERDPALFDAICRRFSSTVYSAEVIGPDLAQSLRTMRDSFDYFKGQCENVIGFYRHRSGEPGSNGPRSQAYPHAMEFEIDFSHINKTLIHFDARDFEPEVQFDDRQAALLLYDYARILMGLNDHAVGPGDARLYADGHAASIDLALPIAALHASGNSPAAYAFSAQHTAMLLAYGWSPSKRPYIESFIGIERAPLEA